MNLPTANRGGRKEASECSNCGWTHKGKKGWGWWALLLHHVRLRGIDRVLCTSCVLRLHPSSFCPLCFVFFDNPHYAPPMPNNSTTVPCSKCSSLAHARCLPTAATPSASYLCPPCSNPSFSFFDLDDTQRFMDAKLASVLLCAARIASASMSRAVIVARADAERKVKEASFAKKRAREALEHLAMVEAREKNSRRKIENENGNGNGNSNVKMKAEVVDSMQSNGNERVETKQNIVTKIEV
ncbi:uncharacterized protein LOC133850992 [Alnus glutinosa]|uniref:uncharacterized protein LOC133850992 n=1 Tax=Alnus glutinosa TaxID=3517 RepID=UPI002D78E70A|nr:uncharacterized protein LOC133850992 [Alnus glutinosa]